jgi:poly-beta-1,6-N-acetyl-D-glucosamine synthase
MNDTSSDLDPTDVVREHSAGEQDLTVIVPAYNEEQSISDTIRSLQQQTLKPKEILVVDDFSSDRTGEIAKACGATVLRPPRNTGSKAGAQNFALDHVKTGLTMAIDADTTLAPDAIEKLLPALQDLSVAAVCGFVIPRHVKTLWERGRYVEYLLAFTWYKPIQDYCDHPLISSGCFSMYRTKILKENGGWSTRTLAEDMDLTWSFYERGYKVRFVHDAVCYPIEPHNLFFMRKQLKRWSHGFVQNVKLHWEDILEIPYLRSFIMVALWDAVLASIAYLILIPTPGHSLLLPNPSRQLYHRYPGSGRTRRLYRFPEKRDDRGPLEHPLILRPSDREQFLPPGSTRHGTSLREIAPHLREGALI